MWYVYILRSELDFKRFYTGLIDNLDRRIKPHNSGQSIHTKKFMPWRVKTFIAFDDHKQACNFEEYLKTASGEIFPRNVYIEKLQPLKRMFGGFILHLSKNPHPWVQIA